MESFRNHALACFVSAISCCCALSAQNCDCHACRFEPEAESAHPDSTLLCAEPAAPAECLAASPEMMCGQSGHGSREEYRDMPWMLGFKTNMLADAAVLPNFGFEIQLAEHFSLDVIATYTEDNVFFPDKNTKVYGFTPELRYWMNDAMHKGHFFGLHANALWYTTKWSDGCLYQNISNSRPAWSVGATYGYNLRLDKENHWGIEFFLGIGYAQYTQDVGEWDANDRKWYSRGIEDKQYIGVTRIGINLIYRFFLRRVKSME